MAFSPQKIFLALAWSLSLTVVAFAIGWWVATRWPSTSESGPLSLLKPTPVPTPLIQWSIPTLSTQTFTPRPITVTKILNSNDTTTALEFTFQPIGKTMTGQLTLPTAWLTSPPAQPVPTIVMARGYVPLESYATGVGTKNAAAAYAQAGFLTLAPDFFGYGGSDPEPEDSWQARFEKPQIMAELLAGLSHPQTVITVQPALLSPPEISSTNSADIIIKPGKFGLWGHSNGGQIILTTLEITQTTYPTTLWAPVTVPFPYSILFFTDELADEGKSSRAWLASFEKNYDVFDFSLTQHLDQLNAPFQLHHGTADEAALKVWSDEFIDKVETENERREEATESAQAAIEFEYFVYPGADHNLRPSWDTVVARDIEFFKRHLKP